MRLNTRTLLGLLIALAVAVALVWQLRRAPRADHAATPAAPAIALNLTNYAPPASAVAPSASGRFAVVATNAPNAPFTNQFAHRLTNSALPFEELLHSDFAVLLRNALLDTRRGAPAIPAHLRAAGEPGAYIVQARGVITEEFRAELRVAGAEIVSYVPNNAYLVRASAGVARMLRSSPLAQAVLPFEPYYKLDARLLALAVAQQPSPHPLVNVVTYPQGAREARAALEQIGATVVGEVEPTVFGDVLVVKAGADQLAAVAQVSSVQMVGVRYEKKLANDLTRPILRVSTNIPFSTNVPIVRPPNNYYSNNVTFKNLTGAGVLVSVSDSGVDDQHPDMIGRVTATGVPDFDGHGTHVTGIIIGDGTQSPLSPATNAMGSLTNAVFSGLAPAARAIVQDYQLPDAVQQRNNGLLAQTNALISNNSWGRPGANDYDIFAASYDAAVRDSLPGVTGEQQVTYVFAAGNEGGGGDNGLNGIPGSIISPATAKNVITVGASDLPRYISNTVVRACEDIEEVVGSVTNIITICQTNQPWYGMTDTNNQISPYSARGNVGIGQEGLFGRFKPDVVAPGSMLVSARSRHYVDPVSTSNTLLYGYNAVSLAYQRTNLYALTIPPNAVAATVLVVTNLLSPTNLVIDLAANINVIPPPGLTGINSITLDSTTSPQLAVGTMYYTVANTFHTNQNVNFDLIVLLTVTNDVGTYYTVLEEMNRPLKQGNQGYRYEAGTSMAAPAISGFLALLQEFLGTNGFNLQPSPALLKALVINGARSISPNYNVQVTAPINHQGWGLASMSNSLPAGFTAAGTNGPMRIYEQSLTNALVTGSVDTYQISVPNEARSFPLRVTLVWTDPPGNPVTGVKLVNDLNLSVVTAVTNVGGTNTAEWIGNNFGPGANFVEPTTVASNGTPVVGVDLTRDVVNNVENIFIRPPLARSYTLFVKGHRVNVNAVNSHPDRHAQDYALVIASGNVVPSNNVNLAVSQLPQTNDLNLRRFAQLLPAPVNTNGLVSSQSAGLLNQRVGANNPLITSTNGATNQWCFFTYTNALSGGFTNVVILTFLPPNLSLARNREADIDLFVAGNTRVPNAHNLTNLDENVISASLRSVGRGGTEYVYLNDAQDGEVFYIGVKSEDQQAANFSIYAESRNGPFSSRDASNNIIVSAFGPFIIPDGSPDQPGGTNAMMFVVNPLDLQAVVQRVWVTNAIYHEEAGDLVGILSRPGGTNAVVLNNHRTWTGWENPVAPFGVVYDDSGQGDLGDPTDTPPVLYPDGPGRLLDYLGEQAGPVWNFTVSDNALFHTGFLNDVTLVIEPGTTNGDSDVILDQRICVRSGTWLYRAVNIPSDAYNLEICVSDFERAITVPIEIYVRWGGFPDFTTYDHFFSTLPPGDCFNIGLGDNPPLTTGRYIIGFFNRDAQDVCLRVRATLSRRSFPGPYVRYTSTDTPKLLLDRDDARTNSIIFVPEYGRISDLRAGIRVDHARASDLAFHLTSPTGTRVLLMENRGRTNERGIGVNFTNVVTNVVRTLINDGFDLHPSRETFPPYDQIIRGPGSVLSGWLVEGSDVDIACCGAGIGMLTRSHSGSNALDLAGNNPNGAIASNANTIIGQAYRLSFAYTRNPSPPPATPLSVSAAVEIDSLPIGTVTYNTLNSGMNLGWITTSMVFQATVTNTKVGFRQLNPGNVSNGGVYLDTIKLEQVEIVTNQFIYLTFTENTNLTTTPIKYGIPPYTNGAYVSSNILIYSNSFASVVGPEWSPNIRTTSPQGSNHLGKFNNSTVNFSYASNQPTHTAIEVSFDLYIIDSWDGFTNNGGPDIWTWQYNGTNILRTTFSNFPRIPYDGHQNYPSNYPFGDFEGQTGAFEVENLGYPNSSSYRMKRVFPHTGGPIQMSFNAAGLQSISDESWGIANFKIVGLNDVTTQGDSYHLPEEPLTPFFGQQAHGNWSLDVWDSRLGAAAPTNALVSWKLEIAFPQTNPPVYFLTNGIPHTNFVRGPGPVFFAVDVPCAQGFTSNTLQCLTNGSSGLDLVFNQYVLPTNGPLDVLLLNNVLTTPQTATLTNGQTPLVNPVRYYLAVYNRNPGETNPFVLTVNFNCGPGAIRLTNDLTICLTNAPGQIQRFDYVSATNAVALQFDVFNITGDNVDLYARQVFNPHPAPGLFHFAGTNAGTTAEFIMVTTNSQPPLIPVIWNLAVTNLGGVTANYCIRAREIYDTNAPLMTLGHMPTNQTLGAGETDYYLVNVTPDQCTVTLSLENHPNGSLNLFTVFRGPRPNLVTNSPSPGIPANVAEVPVLNSTGVWVVAVQNTNNVAVSYDFRASGILCTPFAPIIKLEAASLTTNGFWLRWVAPRTEIYEVQYTTNFTDTNQWISIPPSAVSYDGNFLFHDGGATNQQRFYRLKRLP